MHCAAVQAVDEVLAGSSAGRLMEGQASELVNASGVISRTACLSPTHPPLVPLASL